MKPCRPSLPHRGECLEVSQEECACGCRADDTYCLAEPVLDENVEKLRARLLKTADDFMKRISSAKDNA
jgi:hypothetical protein